jgi:hypothetical protein
MILLHESNLKDEISELSDSEKLKLVNCYYKADTSFIPIEEIAEHISNCPEDYEGVVEYKPEPMDENDYYQTYCKEPEYA